MREFAREFVTFSFFVPEMFITIRGNSKNERIRYFFSLFTFNQKKNLPESRKKN